jgi:hypothetical protein
MRLIITHDTEGTLRSVAFLAKDAEDLEMEPERGESVLTMDAADLPDRTDLSELRGEHLTQYGARLCETLQVRDGRVVQRS